MHPPPPWIDVSRPLSATLGTWPGDTPFSLERVMRIEDGASVNVGALSTSLHAGTHLDAPFHYEADGATVDQLPLDLTCGSALVIDARGAARFGPALLRGRDLGETPRVLLRTDTWRRHDRFPTEWPRATRPFITALAAAGVRLIGLDVPSVDSLRSKSMPMHHAFAAAGICILESLDLRGVKAGRYELCALPLRISGGDASPVRAILRREL